MIKSLLLFLLSLPAFGQVVGIGGQPASAYATSMAQCPTVTSGHFLCIVVPGGTTQPFLALSVAGFNSGAPFAVAPPAPVATFTAAATTLPAGSQATASITTTGSNNLLTIGVPTGATGATGVSGAQGPPGPVQSFTQLNCPTYTLSVTGLLASTCTEK